MKDTRICYVETNGPIKELGNITGPVRKCRLDIGKLISMINNGHVIYELNPENLNERVKLTLTNVTPSPFAKKEVIQPIINDKSPTSKETPELAEPNWGVMEKPIYIPSGTLIEGFKENVQNNESIDKEPSIEADVKDEDVNKETNDTTHVEEHKYSNNHVKYDKKNKHKYNKYQNNGNQPNDNNVVKTTVEEKIVKTDF